MMNLIWENLLRTWLLVYSSDAFFDLDLLSFHDKYHSDAVRALQVSPVKWFSIKDSLWVS